MFEHEVTPGADGWCSATVRNPALGLEVEVRWDAATMPRMWQWVHPAPGLGVLGIEPANCSVLGVAHDRAEGRLPELAPGEERRTRLQIRARAGCRSATSRPAYGYAGSGQPAWEKGERLGAHVTSTCVESGGEVALLDPLAPPLDDPVWERLDARPPPVRRDPQARPRTRRSACSSAATAPARTGRASSGATTSRTRELIGIDPADELPGGLAALVRRAATVSETAAMAARAASALVFADALT